MADRLDVLLGILLDKAAQKDVERGLISIEEELGKLDDTQLHRLSVVLDAIGNVAQDLKDDFAAAREEAGRLIQTSQRVGHVGAVLAAAGGAIVGGLSVSANQYVKFIEQAQIKGDTTADAWIAASKRIQNAQLNLGQASAEALLPIYEKAAALAEKAAEFVSNNPDLVRAALNTGVVVATLGAVGVAVSKGIKLYADFKYLAATAEYALATTRFQKAVREYLSGQFTSLGGGSAGTATTAAGGGLGGTLLKSAAGIAIGVVIAKAIVDAINGALEGTKLGNAIDTAQQKAAEGGGGYPGINRYARATGQADQAASDAADSTEQLSSGLRDFQKEANLAQATKAFVSYRQQEAQAEKQYLAQRADIVKQGNQQIAQIEANYIKQRVQAIKQFAAQQAQAVADFNFQQAQALESFNRSEALAQQEYQNNRKEQVEQFQEEEKNAREDHLREMRKLEEEHQDRVRDLVAARDALGLVREKRDYARRVRDAEEDYRTERTRARKQLKQRLQDMDEQFQAERQRRREDFEFQQAQARENFERQQEIARAQFEERLAQMEEQEKAEIAQIRQQMAERLNELQRNYQEEQILRRNAFLDILRDLDASLLNEETLRNQYYARMQQDLVNFLNSTASAAGGAGSNLPGYQSGGYTPEGPIRTHRGEYVLDPQSTRSLEKLVGGRLTRDSIQSFAQGGSSTTVNLQFPGGLITKKILEDSLDRNTAKLLKNLTRGLA